MSLVAGPGEDAPRPAECVGIQVIGEPGETPMAGFWQLAEQLSAEAAR